MRSLLDPLRQLTGVALAAAAMLSLVGPAQSQTKPKAPGTLSFVITTWNYAILETRFHDECPEGFTIGVDEIWWRGLSKAARAKATQNGELGDSERFIMALQRGPNKENVCLNPTLVKDPPMFTVEGPTAYGMNLDGTTDGKATPKTCAHQKFTGVDGTPAVDNQVYRLLGCIYGWHKYDNIQSNANINRKTTGNGIVLVEVTGVDDTRNDDNVSVTFHHAIDQYALDGQGEFQPYASYRTDPTLKADGTRRYGGTVRGKIVNGELTTEPADLNLPFYGNYTYMDEFFRDFRIRMKIAEDGETAKGTAAGYYDVDQLVYYIGGLGVIMFPSQADCPAIYVAAHQLADGYPDPKTGECKSLSSAYNFEAVSAFTIHSPDPTLAQAKGPLDRVLTTFGIGK